MNAVLKLKWLPTVVVDPSDIFCSGDAFAGRSGIGLQDTGAPL